MKLINMTNIETESWSDRKDTCTLSDDEEIKNTRENSKQCKKIYTSDHILWLDE